MTAATPDTALRAIRAKCMDCSDGKPKAESRACASSMLAISASYARPNSVRSFDGRDKTCDTTLSASRCASWPHNN